MFSSSALVFPAQVDLRYTYCLRVEIHTAKAWTPLHNKNISKELLARVLHFNKRVFVEGSLFSIFASGGVLMYPLLLCSILVIGITIERYWSLDPKKVAPRHQSAEVWKLIKDNKLDKDNLKRLRQSSDLGQILAAGLSNSRMGRDVMKDSIQEAAARVVHDLERFLAILGTIAAIAPLLGLLGTVIGMIKVFTALNLEGAGNAGALAGGISEALITTAAGLIVAIPAMIAYRFFVRRVDSLVVQMEQDAVKIVDALHSNRDVDLKKA